MRPKPDFQLLSEAISAAADNPDEWPVFLGLLGRALSSDHVVLHRELMNGSRRSRVSFHWGVNPEGVEKYEAYYGPKNPVFVHGRAILIPGRPGLRQEACSDRMFFSSEYYNDFARKLDIQDTLGVVLLPEPQSALMIGVHGSHARERFGDSDLQLMRELVPHLQTALKLQSRLGMLEARVLQLQAAVDALTDAVLVLGPDGDIRAENKAAQEILASGDGIAMVQGRVQLRTRSEQDRLDKLLAGMVEARHRGVEPAGGAVRVRRPSGEPDWLLQIVPGDRRAPNVAVVFLVSSSDAGQPSDEDLESLFELSPMQRRIAVRLFEGSLPNEVADELRISRNTFKTHVRRLFSKLGVSRQTELMRLLARLRPRR